MECAAGGPPGEVEDAERALVEIVRRPLINGEKHIVHRSEEPRAGAIRLELIGRERQELRGIDALAESRKLPEPVVAPIRAHQRNRLKDVENRKDGNDHHKKLSELNDELELVLIEAERDLVNTLYRSGELKDEGRRRIERELDLRDALLANLRPSE
jgi:hypothetical protein